VGEGTAGGYDTRTDARRTSVTEQDFKDIIERARGRSTVIGSRTVKRAILSNTFNRNAVNAGSADTGDSNVLVTPNVGKILYSKRKSPEQLMQDFAKAVAQGME
jgi:hypothetical protein